MAEVGIDPTKLTDGYLEKLKEATTETARLERRAKSLSKQQAEKDSRRTELEAGIEAEQVSIGMLQLERSELQKTWMDADFNSDAATKREVQQRRAEIDGELEKNQAKLEKLQQKVDSLGSLETEAATAAIELEAIKTGNTLAFIAELRTALQQYESDLQARIREAKKKLPTFTLDTFEEIKEELVDGYAEKRQRKIEERSAYQAKEHSRAEAAKRTYQAATDERGFIVGWHVKDEAGNIVGYEKAKLVEV